MNDVHTYRIKLRGKVETRDINVNSPLHLNVERLDQGATLLSVHTDQSGLIGLMRHLHGLGFTLLSVDCVPKDLPENRSADPL
jgi:hypothetical protein